ncbi:MAG TPA: hypothetical protein PLR25_00455 [Planctomycetaceae bacterium]|nr:hypothetical protein [Planctomycetaceae bacterium]
MLFRCSSDGSGLSITGTDRPWEFTFSRDRDVRLTIQLEPSAMRKILLRSADNTCWLSRNQHATSRVAAFKRTVNR